MTNMDGYKARWGANGPGAGATEELARSKILQLIRAPSPQGEDAQESDADFQKLRASLNLGAAKLRELTHRNRSDTLATEQALAALRREVVEERARYERLKKDFEAVSDEQRHALATAERRILELDASNKSLAAGLEAASRELARLRQWFFNLSTDAEAIRTAIDDANHLTSRGKQEA